MYVYLSIFYIFKNSFLIYLILQIKAFQSKHNFNYKEKIKTRLLQHFITIDKIKRLLNI